MVQTLVAAILFFLREVTIFGQEGGAEEEQFI